MSASPDAGLPGAGTDQGVFVVPPLAWAVAADAPRGPLLPRVACVLDVLTGSRVGGSFPSREVAALREDLVALRDGDPVGAASPLLLGAAALLPCKTRFTVRASPAACALVRSLGAHVEPVAEGVEVVGGGGRAAVHLDVGDDPELASAGLLAGLLRGGISLDDRALPAATRVALREFGTHLVRSRRCVAVVGMRGAGKSTFAAAFARRTGTSFVDTDLEFEARHGPIATFVAGAGWPRFRLEEARVLRESLGVERVVATGGGALEDATSRALLAEATLVVWLDAPPALSRERLARPGQARPSVTGADSIAELAELHARRAAGYAECAFLRLDAAASTEDLVSAALDALAIRSVLGRLPCTRRP